MSQLSILERNSGKKNVIANFLVILYFCLIFSSYFFEIGAINGVLAAFGTVVLIWQGRYIAKNHSKLLVVFLLFGLYSVVCIFFVQQRSSYTLIRLFIQFSLLILFLRFDIKIIIVRGLLYFYAGSVIFLIVSGIKPSLIFDSASQNIVGWLGLGMGVLYYTMLQSKGKRFEIYTALIVLLLAFVCLGRSTIAGALMLLGLVFWKIYRAYPLYLKALVFFFSLSLLFIVYNEYFEIFQLGFQKFNQKGFDSNEREYIIKAYMGKLNFRTYIFGVSSEQNPFTFFNKNFHNSYLSGHSIFGVFFLFFIVYIFRSLLYPVKKGSDIYKIFLIIILFRSATDTISFMGDLDFVIYYLLYQVWLNKTKFFLKPHLTFVEPKGT